MAIWGRTIAVSGTGDRAGLHAAIWTAARTFVGSYTASDAYRPAYDYLDEMPHPPEWGPSGDRLGWWFDDGDGAYTCSARAWPHWFGLFLATEWAQVTDLAVGHDLTVTGHRPDLGTLQTDRDARLLSLRGSLWFADGAGAAGDGAAHVPLDALDPAERATVAEAVRSCRCGMCTMLRPDAGLLDLWTRSLRDARVRPATAWYLARVHEPTVDVLLALVRAGDGAMGELRDPVERCAPFVAGARPALLAALPGLTGGARGLALYAAAATAADADAQAEVLVAARATLATAEFRDLAAPAEAAEAAAEVAGQVGRGAPGLAGELAALLDRPLPDPVRHNVVLGLINAHLPPAAPPDPAVRARLQQEAERGPATELARWAVESMFPA